MRRVLYYVEKWNPQSLRLSMSYFFFPVAPSFFPKPLPSLPLQTRIQNLKNLLTLNDELFNFITAVSFFITHLPQFFKMQIMYYFESRNLRERLILGDFKIERSILWTSENKRSKIVIKIWIEHNLNNHKIVIKIERSTYSIIHKTIIHISSKL